MPDPVPMVNIATRIPPANVERADRVAVALAARRPGETVRRADVLRIAIERGLEVLERELDITAEQSAKPAPKGGKARVSKPAK